MSNGRWGFAPPHTHLCTWNMRRVERGGGDGVCPTNGNYWIQRDPRLQKWVSRRYPNFQACVPRVSQLSLHLWSYVLTSPVLRSLAALPQTR